VSLGLVALVGEITTRGGSARYAVCDVADVDDVEHVAATAVGEYGRIDTWVNAAAVSVYARFEDTTLDEFRRVMDVNFMGQVHGAKAALPHLRRGGGGALISISSVESLSALPLHSAYVASKHAAEGMIEALRRELLSEGAPISVTSVKPATINTPFFRNSLNKMDVKPQGPPPVYQPSVVADCVLYAAQHPVRDLYAGGAGKMMALNQLLAPRFMDAAMAKLGIPLQRTDEPEVDGEDALYTPRVDDGRAEGDLSDQARPFSLYTWTATHPTARRAATGGFLATAGMLLVQAHRR
jgi:NAD(P)-dependent dehydrogenase (short-subunit alcohol dehydrogenase family)